MPAGHSGRIGPNAILQLVPVLEERLGPQRLRIILMSAGIRRLPDGSAMIPEQDAARLHRAVRHFERERADEILREAGARTADYILAHRIPKAAQAILKRLPASLAALILSRAIAQHAWTFAGSGSFRALTPWRFEIAHNPLIADERSEHPLCIWHCAVFEKLYRTLVTKDAVCIEERCGSQAPDAACLFSIRRSCTA